jgi:hypothetical protein
MMTNERREKLLAWAQARGAVHLHAPITSDEVIGLLVEPLDALDEGSRATEDTRSPEEILTRAFAAGPGGSISRERAAGLALEAIGDALDTADAGLVEHMIAGHPDSVLGHYRILGKVVQRVERILSTVTGLMLREPTPSPTSDAVAWGERPGDKADPNYGRCCGRCGGAIRAGMRYVHECPLAIVTDRAEQMRGACAVLLEAHLGYGPLDPRYPGSLAAEIRALPLPAARSGETP